MAITSDPEISLDRQMNLTGKTANTSNAGVCAMFSRLLSMPPVRVFL
jgi:hypothetical protein